MFFLLKRHLSGSKGESLSIFLTATMRPIGKEHHGQVFYFFLTQLWYLVYFFQSFIPFFYAIPFVSIQLLLSSLILLENFNVSYNAFFLISHNRYLNPLFVVIQLRLSQFFGASRNPHCTLRFFYCFCMLYLVTEMFTISSSLYFITQLQFSFPLLLPFPLPPPSSLLLCFFSVKDRLPMEAYQVAERLRISPFY